MAGMAAARTERARVSTFCSGYGPASLSNVPAALLRGHSEHSQGLAGARRGQPGRRVMLVKAYSVDSTRWRWTAGGQLVDECACRRVSAGKKVKKQSRHEHASETHKSVSTLHNTWPIEKLPGQVPYLFRVQGELS